MPDETEAIRREMVAETMPTLDLVLNWKPSTGRCGTRQNWDGTSKCWDSPLPSSSSSGGQNGVRGS